MKPSLLPVCLFLGILMASAAAPLQAAEPQRVIFDTDMGNDIDDAMALAVIHQLQSRGLVELLAVTSTKDHPKSAAFIDATNTFYGRPDIPVGAVRDGVTPAEGRYIGLVDRRDAAGQLLFPHDLKAPAAAVPLLRQTLAAQPDGSVTILQVGFFTNLAQLLASEPDEYAPLPGVELVDKKVRELLVMAGAFQTIGFETAYREYNVREDVAAAQTVAQRWPTPILWSGYEIGIAAAYPWQSILQDFEYTRPHIIKEGYLAWARNQPHDRPTWDLTVVLQAVFPDRGYFELSPRGEVTVDETGRTEFRKNAEGNDRYLLMDARQAARVREVCVQLVAAPPSP